MLADDPSLEQKVESMRPEAIKIAKL